MEIPDGWSATRKLTHSKIPVVGQSPACPSLRAIDKVTTKRPISGFAECLGQDKILGERGHSSP